jgi:DNA-binding MarR family transcriptional regulator
MDTNKQGDLVDRIISVWREVYPDLDPSALNVVGRVIVLAQRLERSVNDALEQHGITFGQYDILATLRRNGERGELSPRELLKNVALSSGAMTARLDRLAEAGLIVRKPDPNDRRMLVIELTQRGNEVIEAAAATRFEEARRSLPPFEPEELETLAQLLRRWLIEVTERQG